MIRVFVFTVFMFVMSTAVAGNRDVSVDVVWHESQSGAHTIKLMQFRDDEWGGETAIYRSNNFVSSTAISTLKDGTKIVFWSEDVLAKTTIYYQIQKDKLDFTRWTDPQKIHERCRECLASAPVLDLDGVMWLFWTDNADGQDDVFFSQLVQSRWANPERVNLMNDVPDIKPIANLNEFGQVEVVWSAYSVLMEQYANASKSFGPQLNEAEIGKIVSDLSTEELPFPAFLPYNSPPEIHVPVNRFKQTILTQQ